MFNSRCCNVGFCVRKYGIENWLNLDFDFKLEDEMIRNRISDLLSRKTSLTF